MSLTILVIDDEANFRENVCEFLSSLGHETHQAGTLEEGRKLVNQGVGELVLLDIQLPDGYGPDLLAEISMQSSAPLVIMITGFGDIDTAVEVMKSGAHDFLTKPVKFERLQQTIGRAADIIHMRRELAQFRKRQGQEAEFVVGRSKGMQTLIERAKRVSTAEVSVLIQGETGTGKEVIAKFLHKSGARANKPFMPINCAALQPTVIESELFGYEAGAFTGAQKRKLGLMEVADQGILFLDEIASMSLDMQSKLLRALEERKIRRVGGSNLIPVDVQVIAASNRDLPEMIKAGVFREDLYYRLHVVDLEVPALRNRKEDIPELVGFFLKQKNAQMGLNVTGVGQNAMKALIAYDWPGNVRELKNAIERALIFCDGDQIEIGQLPQEVQISA
jgi:two-component system response regulator AtoC